LLVKALLHKGRRRLRGEAETPWRGGASSTASR
jgi:hypothetical protein